MPGHNPTDFYALIPVLACLSAVAPQAVAAVIAALTVMDLMHRLRP